MRFETTTRKTVLMLVTCSAFLLPSAMRAQTGPQVSLTLSEAIDLALKQNRSLRLAKLSVIDSEHRKAIARSAYFPKITNQSSILHVTELAGIDIPAGAFGVPAATGAIPDQPIFIGQGGKTSYTSGTQLAQPLTQVFKIRESNKAARADIETAKIELTQAEDLIALKVRKVYCDLLVAQLNLQASTEEVSASQLKDRENMDAVAQGRALDVAILEGQASTIEAQQAVLTRTLSMHTLTISLSDLLGLPLDSKLQLDPEPSALNLLIPSREECVRAARAQSPAIRVARQSVLKAKAGLGAAKDAYIPDITGLARYSYQSGVPLLVHNFGTFGVNLTYDLFDGGRRAVEIKDAATLLTEAQVNLDRATEEVDIEVESAYDKVEESESFVKVIQKVLDLRTESARLADRQYEQDAALGSTQAAAHAKLALTQASLLEATLSLSLAQGDLKRIMGQMPR